MPDLLDDQDAYLAGLWDSFKQDGSPEARERIILHYAPIVKFVAGRVGAGLPRSVESADLVSYGILGLIDAIQRFDPAREIKFETFALPRIRGAILDELRALDWVPRSVRAKSREIERAVAKLEAELRREPEDFEVAEELGLTVDEFRARLKDVSAVQIVALEELLTIGGDSGERVSVLDSLADPRVSLPGESVEVREAREALVAAINSLRDRDRTVVILYYFEGLTLSQIGEVLGVTESRVSQIHSKAVMHLRSKLTDETGLTTPPL